MLEVGFEGWEVLTDGLEGRLSRGSDAAGGGARALFGVNADWSLLSATMLLDIDLVSKEMLCEAHSIPIPTKFN